VGRILVTTFGNPWRSLVRFDIGDVVQLDGHTPCPCGCREGLTLTSVEGRTVHLTLSPEGRAVTQGSVDRALASIRGLVEYQVLQTGSSAYHLRYVVEGDASRPVANEARDVLQAVYGPEAAITADCVEAIAPDPPGKYCLSRRLESFDPDALLDNRFAPSDR
jgi:phenylacetate-coenzyme A ligase PaaK-like adenylate-forming protein